MLSFLARRVPFMLMMLVLASTLAFFLIELPPGDYLSNYVMSLQAQGTHVTEEEVASLKRQYGLDQPVYARYIKWVSGIVLRGDFGMSFEFKRPVRDLVLPRIPMTVLVSLGSFALTYSIAITVGIFSATRRYTISDYVISGLSFIALGMPDFLLALLIMYTVLRYLGLSVGGLFSTEYIGADWSWGKVFDLLKHLPFPALVIGITTTGGLIRVMRGCLLDEMNKPYVATARAKGLTERKLLYKYPVRISINPIISTIGWTLPALVSGQTIVSVVMSLPTVGPVLLLALMDQDMYLAGSILLLLTALTIVGTLISDILLAWVDPRIRYGQ